MDERKFVRKNSLEKDLPGCQGVQVKLLTKVIVWSVFLVMCTRELKIVKRNLNQVGYRDIINRRLPPQLRELFSDNDCFLSCTMEVLAKTVKIHLDNHGIRVLDWPGNTPDLNTNRIPMERRERQDKPSRKY